VKTINFYGPVSRNEYYTVRLRNNRHIGALEYNDTNSDTAATTILPNGSLDPIDYFLSIIKRKGNTEKSDIPTWQYRVVVVSSLAFALHNSYLMSMTFQEFDSWGAMDVTAWIRVIWGILSSVFATGMVLALGFGAVYFGRNPLS
jgi:hypothetical protein